MVSAYDLKSFCSSLGMNATMAKEALLVVNDIIKR